MLMQTVVWMSPFAIAAQAEQLTHLADHVQDVGHHHRADASLHLDSDSESTAHVHVDNGFQPLGLTALAVEAGVLALQGAAPGSPCCEPPAVFLDGLLRPPSATA